MAVVRFLADAKTIVNVDRLNRVWLAPVFPYHHHNVVVMKIAARDSSANLDSVYPIRDVPRTVIVQMDSAVIVANVYPMNPNAEATTIVCPVSHVSEGYAKANRLSAAVM